MLTLTNWTEVIRREVALGRDPFGEHCRADPVIPSQSPIAGKPGAEKCLGTICVSQQADPSSGNMRPVVTMLSSEGGLEHGH